MRCLSGCSTFLKAARYRYSCQTFSVPLALICLYIFVNLEVNMYF